MFPALLLSVLLLFPTAVLAMIDYQLDVSLFPSEQRLVATAQISFEQPVENQLSLQLSEDCEIVAVQQTGKDLDYQFNKGTLQIERLNSAPISISYRGRFADAVAESPVHNEDPSYGVSASISEQGSYLSAGVHWYPRLNSEKIAYRVSIEAPEGIEAITSGERSEHKTENGRSRSTWKVAYPLYGLTLSAGNYQIFEDRNGKVPIYAYFYPESAPLAATYLQEARNYLQLYEQLFGPYPFHKFAIVENFFPTGYGLPSWTLLGSSVIKLPFIVKTSLGHEMAHSWWGTGVRVDYSQGNWSEGLTTYVADYLYKERSSPNEARDYRLKILRDYASLVNHQNSFTVSRFSSRQDKASQAIGYGKAAMLFHMLRQQVGEEAFWGGLRQLAEERMFTQVGWNDFEQLFSAISNRDLKPFFQQWLTRTTGPELSFADMSIQQTADGWTVSGKLLQQPPYYRLMVDLQLLTAEEPLDFVAEINGAEQPFQFHLVTKPLSLIADPAANLFRILASEEIPSTVNAIRGSNELLVIRADQNGPPFEAQQMLLGAMRKTGLPIQSRNEVSKDQLASHDLLIFGTPQALLPEDMVESSTAEELNLNGQPVHLANHSAFVVTRNPFNQQRHAAWFISRDTDQAAIVARKIPHYGKYSYLLFEESTNRAKGIWEAPKSPLRIEF